MTGELYIEPTKEEILGLFSIESKENEVVQHVHKSFNGQKDSRKTSNNIKGNLIYVFNYGTY